MEKVLVIEMCIRDRAVEDKEKTINAITGGVKMPGGF